MPGLDRSDHDARRGVADRREDTRGDLVVGEPAGSAAIDDEPEHDLAVGDPGSRRDRSALGYAGGIGSPLGHGFGYGHGYGYGRGFGGRPGYGEASSWKTVSSE